MIIYTLGKKNNISTLIELNKLLNNNINRWICVGNSSDLRIAKIYYICDNTIDYCRNQILKLSKYNFHEIYGIQFILKKMNLIFDKIEFRKINPNTNDIFEKHIKQNQYKNFIEFYNKIIDEYCKKYYGLNDKVYGKIL